MSFDDKKPEKRPLYIFVLIAVVVILLLNMFAIPAMQERSIEKTDYSTFLSNVEHGDVSKAEVQDTYSSLNPMKSKWEKPEPVWKQ